MSELSALLEREASTEIEAIVAEARSRASALVAEAKAEAEALLEQRRRSVAAEREAALVRAKSAAQLEASSLRLRAQHDEIETVFATVRDRITGLGGDRAALRRVLGALLTEAVEAVGAGEVESVEAAPADVATVTELASAARLSAPVLPASDVAFGVRVRTKQRSAVENTLSVRLATLENELAADVSRTLFADAPVRG
jgi:V/A-type H+/Na+-transporting ATPase subunit E